MLNRNYFRLSLAIPVVLVVFSLTQANFWNNGYSLSSRCKSNGQKFANSRPSEYCKCIKQYGKYYEVKMCCRRAFYYNTNSQKCSRTPGGGYPVTLHGSHSCPANYTGLLNYKKHPDYYHVCGYGRSFVARCFRGCKFDANENRCVKKRKPISVRIWDKSDRTLNVTIPKCKRPGTYPVENSKKLYYKCIQGTYPYLYQEVRKCNQQMEYDNIKKRCIPIKFNYSVKCFKEGCFPIPQNCEMYYVCKKLKNGKFCKKFKFCPTGKAFDEYKGACVKERLSSCVRKNEQFYTTEYSISNITTTEYPNISDIDDSETAEQYDSDSSEITISNVPTTEYPNINDIDDSSSGDSGTGEQYDSESSEISAEVTNNYDSNYSDYDSSDSESDSETAEQFYENLERSTSEEITEADTQILTSSDESQNPVPTKDKITSQTETSVSTSEEIKIGTAERHKNTAQILTIAGDIEDTESTTDKVPPQTEKSTSTDRYPTAERNTKSKNTAQILTVAGETENPVATRKKVTQNESNTTTKLPTTTINPKIERTSAETGSDTTTERSKKNKNTAQILTVAGETKNPVATRSKVTQNEPNTTTKPPTTAINPKTKRTSAETDKYPTTERSTKSKNTAQILTVPGETKNPVATRSKVTQNEPNTSTKIPITTINPKTERTSAETGSDTTTERSNKTKNTAQIFKVTGETENPVATTSKVTQNEPNTTTKIPTTTINPETEKTSVQTDKVFFTEPSTTTKILTTTINSVTEPSTPKDSSTDIPLTTFETGSTVTEKSADNAVTKIQTTVTEPSTTQETTTKIFESTIASIVPESTLAKVSTTTVGYTTAIIPIAETTLEKEITSEKLTEQTTSEIPPTTISNSNSKSEITSSTTGPVTSQADTSTIKPITTTGKISTNSAKEIVETTTVKINTAETSTPSNKKVTESTNVSTIASDRTSIGISESNTVTPETEIPTTMSYTRTTNKSKTKITWTDSSHASQTSLAEGTTSRVITTRDVSDAVSAETEVSDLTTLSIPSEISSSTTIIVETKVIEPSSGSVTLVTETPIEISDSDVTVQITGADDITWTKTTTTTNEFTATVPAKDITTQTAKDIATETPKDIATETAKDIATATAKDIATETATVTATEATTETETRTPKVKNSKVLRTRGTQTETTTIRSAQSDSTAYSYDSTTHSSRPTITINNFTSGYEGMSTTYGSIPTAVIDLRQMTQATTLQPIFEMSTSNDTAESEFWTEYDPYEPTEIVIQTTQTSRPTKMGRVYIPRDSGLDATTDIDAGDEIQTETPPSETHSEDTTFSDSATQTPHTTYG